MRQAAAERYDALLSQVEEVIRPCVLDGNEHVWHLYVVRVPDRDRVIKELHAAGIGAGIHYPVPIHLDLCLRRDRVRGGRVPRGRTGCSRTADPAALPGDHARAARTRGIGPDGGRVMNVPQPLSQEPFDLQRTNVIPFARPAFGSEEPAAVYDAVMSDEFGRSGKVHEFERAFAKHVGVPYAIAVSSCTTALHLGLAAWDIGVGDEVVVPSLSFIATANAVKYVGATPVFADVDPATQNLTPESIEPVLSPATKAVLVVHQAGMPADVDAIRAVCEPRGVAVLEDAACAAGAQYKGRPISGAGGFAAFSFHPRKVLSTGEGGAITTDDPGMAEILRSLTTHGVQPADSPTAHQQYVRVGFDYAMCDPLAAIGIVQLRKLDAIVHQRRVLGARYRALLGDIAGLQMIADTPYGQTNYQAFWVLLPEDFPLDRDGTMKTLMERGIMTRRGVMAAHLEPPYAGVEHVPLPVTERMTRNSLTLPLFHDMTPEQQDHVISAFHEIAR